MFGLLIHRAGVAKSLRAVGGACWSLAAAYEIGVAEMKARFRAAMEQAKELEERS